ncbi:hypothetical protein JB92DRAFT_3115739 [Gautieria morchelliformis]|nr:hypothetical protein JB92DRAFT_3115739 [Gautieria morchelliformis]
MSPASVATSSPPPASSPHPPSCAIAPRIIRGESATRCASRATRILHEFHAENAPALLLHGISIVVVFHTAQFPEGIGLNVFHAHVGVVTVVITFIISLYFALSASPL